MEGIQLRKVSGKIIASHVNHEGVIKEVPPAVYSISVTDTGDIILTTLTNRYNLPKTIMGETLKHRDLILNAHFENTDESTGVIMTGLAGSGKSMLAECLCNEMMEVCNMPVFLIDKKLNNNIIKDVMRIAKYSVVYFDELGKYYDHVDQGKLLTVFSDSEFKNNLYIVCDNEQSSLHRFFFDRPGRFLFHLDFKGLSKELVDEYLNKMKVDGILREYIEEYVEHHRKKVSFDILRTLVKFSKKFKVRQQYIDFIKMINVPHPPIVEYKLVSLTKGEDTYGVNDYSLTYNRLEGEFTLIIYKDKKSFKFKLTDEENITISKEKDGNGDFTYMIEFDGYHMILSSSKKAPNGSWEVNATSEDVGSKEDIFSRSKRRRNPWDDQSYGGF